MAKIHPLFASRLRWGLILCGLLILGLTGCASWSRPADPVQVQLLDVRLIKARVHQQQFELRFRIDNPDDSGLWVRGLRFRVSVADIPLVDDEHSQWLRIGGHEHAIMVVPVRTNLWGQLRPLAKRVKQNRDAIPYRLEGKLKTGLLFRHNVRIERNGEIIPADLIAE